LIILYEEGIETYLSNVLGCLGSVFGTLLEVTDELRKVDSQVTEKEVSRSLGLKRAEENVCTEELNSLINDVTRT